MRDEVEQEQAALPPRLPMIPLRVTQDSHPFIPLGVVELPSVPRAGEMLFFTVESRVVTGTVSWINYYPDRSAQSIELGVSFVKENIQEIPNDADESLRKLTEFNTKIYEKAASHNNVMMLAGYAGLFATWGFIKDFLSQSASLWIAVTLGLSLLLFVTYELIAMYMRSLPFLRFAKLRGKPAGAFIAALPAFEEQGNRASLIAVRIWQALFFPIVLFAYSSAMLLMLNIVLKLMQAKSWPA